MTQPAEQVGTRLMFENERIRVWDLALAPGETLQAHVHRHDFCFIVLQGGQLRHVHPHDPDQNQDVRYETDQVVFLQAGNGLAHHPLVNVGKTPYRNLVIELKSS